MTQFYSQASVLSLIASMLSSKPEDDSDIVGGRYCLSVIAVFLVPHRAPELLLAGLARCDNAIDVHVNAQ